MARLVLTLGGRTGSGTASLNDPKRPLPQNLIAFGETVDAIIIN